MANKTKTANTSLIDELKIAALQHATSVAAQQKVKKAAKFEKEVEGLLRKYELLPNQKDSKGDYISLTGSPFKTKFFPNYITIDNGVKMVHQKLTDFWVPKYNLLVECTTSISDTKEKEFYISRQSVDEMNKQKYDGIIHDYVVFVQSPAADIMAKRLEKAGVKIIYGISNIEKYIIERAKTPAHGTKLNMGVIEYHPIDRLTQNAVNREINWKHVWNLVESILTFLGKSKVQVGLIRPFTAIKVNGEVNLVDAHHLREAVKIVRDIYGYEIDDVPVMILAHLNNVHPEEVTQLMSSINVIVLNWDNFGYVKSWKTTYEMTGNSEALYPYKKLYDDMVELSKLLKAKDYTTGGVNLQAYCIEDSESIAKWGENLKNMKTGNLRFNEEHYDNVLIKIKNAVKIFNEAINLHREAMAKHPSYRKGKLIITHGQGNKKVTESIDLVSAKANYLRQFATSLKSLYFTNESVFFNVVDNVDVNFWKKVGLATPTLNEINSIDYMSIKEFPKKPNELKEFIEGTFSKDKTTNVKYWNNSQLAKYVTFMY